jgi:hypothetical protein
LTLTILQFDVGYLFVITTLASTCINCDASRRRFRHDSLGHPVTSAVSSSGSFAPWRLATFYRPSHWVGPLTYDLSAIPATAQRRKEHVL